MKTNHLKACFKAICIIALAVAACMATQSASAQVLFGWSITNTSGFGVSPLPSTTNNPNVTTSPLMRASGLNTSGTAVSFAWGADGWTTTTNESTAIAASQFITFGVTVNTGYTMSITNLQVFNFQRTTNAGAAGPTNGVLQYSINGGSFVDFKTNSYITAASGKGNSGPFNMTSIAALQNLGAGTSVTFRIVNLGASNSTGGWFIADPTTGLDDIEFRGTLVSSGVAPTNLVVTPASQTKAAGTTATFQVQAGGDPGTNLWFFVSGGVTNQLSSSLVTTNFDGSILSLPSVTAANAGSYFATIANLTGGPVTSSVVTLAVQDPTIYAWPDNAFGLLHGQVQFFVNAFGSSLGYQWYYATTNGSIVGPVANGVNSYSASMNSGVTSALLTITNLTATDLTNYVVVVTNSIGTSITSPPVSILSVGTNAVIAFWNFNGTNFSNNISSPPPYYGVGTAGPVGSISAPFAGSADSQDGAGLPGFGLGGPPYISWGMDASATQGTSNKLDGLSFMFSTVGARNIVASYDCRATGTASGYERLQYTTNSGMTWIDYPASTSFGTPNPPTATNQFGNVGVIANSYANFTNYDFAGFTNVDNNPDFGVRIVMEFESTATYGASTYANYYGADNAYGTTGTLTYDLVTFQGSYITNSSLPPSIGSIANASVNDFTNVVVPFTVTGPNPGSLVFSATSLGNAWAPSPVSSPPTGPLALDPSRFSFSGSAPSINMTINPLQGFDGIGPILVTATDTTTGLESTAWFYLTVNSINAGPTNSLSVTLTNTLVNTPITIPFTVTDPNTGPGGFTFTAFSANNTVVSSANITFINTNTSTPSVVITPNTNTVGEAPISIVVTDSGVTFNGQSNQDIRSITNTLSLEVKPNTNIVLVDYFNYDNAGSLALIDPTMWGHLSGNANQIVEGSTFGYVTLNTLANTENLVAPLSTTFTTNSSAVVYVSFDVNMLNNANLPIVNGTHFADFNQGGSGTNLSTANIACRIGACTNGVATNGNYRLFVSNGGADASAGQIFPMDLVPGNDYIVVAQCVVSNNQSTLWVNPASPSSPSVKDTTTASPLFNIAAYELRESGTNAGAVSISKLKVGTTFDSVLPSLKIAQVGANVVLTSSDPTLPIVSATDVRGPYTNAASSTPYTNAISATTETFYHFGVAP